MKRYTLELTVFVSGAVIMILEIVGSRILAPYLGTSIYVWTSIIGIILGSLSIGYWLGGKLADNKARYDLLSFILFASGIAIAFLAVSNGVVLKGITRLPLDIRLQAIFASIILLAPASILLGCIAPYATRLKLANIETSGRTVGNLSAISTVGCIFGTFLTGFYLLSWIGVTKILFLLSLILILFSILGFRGERTKTRITLMIFVLMMAGGQYWSQKEAEARGFIDVDSAYNRIFVQEGNWGSRGIMRMMMISGELNSAMFLDSNDLAAPYSEYYRLARHFTPNIQSALMIGAGGYSYPKDFLASFSEATMDVVEIDPKTTELAKKYFNLKDSPRLSIYHEDGRTFLNKSQKKYDAIYGDAFGSFYAIPYGLTTKEAVSHMYRLLNDDGVVVVNLISSLGGEKGKFLASEYRTFREVFPQVYLFPTEDKADTERTQNIILVAMKSNEPPALSSDDAELTHYLTKLWVGVLNKDAPVLTDDFAPVDQLVAAMAGGRPSMLEN